MHDTERRSPKIFESKIFYISLCLLIALSIGVNLLTVTDQSIRLDEAQSLWAATKSVSGILYYISQDVQVPLYELLLHFWIQIFGTDIAIARGLSFIFFILTLPVLYKAYRQVAGSKVSLLGVTIFSLSPFILWYSNEARMYTMFALATSLDHLFFLKFYKSKGKDGKLGYFLSTLFGLFSHYFFIFFLFTQFVFVIYSTLSNSKVGGFKAKLQSKQRFLIRYIAVLVADGIFFLPWAVYFILQGFASSTQPLIPTPTSYDIFATFINFLFGFQSTKVQTLMVSLWPLIVLLLFFIFTRRKSAHILYKEYFIFTAFFPIFLMFLLSFFKPIFLSRYLIFVTPSLFFLVSWMLLSFAKKTSYIIVSIFLLLLLSLLFYQNLSPFTPVKENYIGVSEFLDKKATASDLIAVSAPFTIYPVAYTYKGEAGIVTIPQWNLYTQGPIPKFSVANLKKEMQIYQKEYNNIFIVLSYNQGYQQDIQQYMDTNYKRLIDRTFSPGLEVEEYQLRYDIQRHNP